MPVIYIPTLEDEKNLRLQRIRANIEELANKQGIVVYEKEKSWLMRALGKLLFFNRWFMLSYITTIGKTVYFPQELLQDDLSYCTIMPHEMVHVVDMKNNPHWIVLYLFPQFLSVFSLLSLFALYNSWHLLWLVMVLFLLPFPAYWRKKMEMRGFAMTLAVNEWLDNSGKFRKSPPPTMQDYFTGPDYYYMWPFENGVREELQLWLDRVHRDELQQHLELADEIKKIFSEV